MLCLYRYMQFSLEYFSLPRLNFALPKALAYKYLSISGTLCTRLENIDKVGESQLMQLRPALNQLCSNNQETWANF